MEKYHLYNQYVLNLFEKRFAFGEPEASSGASASEDVPAEAETADADKQTTEPAKEGPTPSADEAKRNMTRTHAKRVSDRLKTMNDADAKKLAEEIDTAYSESVTAEVSHDKASIETATNSLRSILLSGEAILSGAGAERSSAEKYAQRELGLEEDIEKKKNLDQAKGGASKAEKELNEKVENEDARKNILASVKSVKDEAKNAENDLDYEVATQKYTEYATKVRAKINKAPKEKVETTPEGLRTEALKKMSEYMEKSKQDSSEKELIKDQGQQLILDGEAAMIVSKPDEAKAKFGDAIAHFKQALQLSAAAAADSSESQEKIEAVDRQALIGQMRQEFIDMSRKYTIDSPDSERLADFNKAMNDVYAKIADTDAKKMALAGSAFSVAQLNPDDDDEAFVIRGACLRPQGFTLNAIAVDRDGQEGALTDAEMAALEKVEEGNVENISEKTKTLMVAELEGIIDGRVKYFLDSDVIPAFKLKNGLQFRIAQYYATLTDKEKTRLGNWETGIRRASGKVFDYQYEVKIRNGNVEAWAD